MILAGIQLFLIVGCTLDVPEIDHVPETSSIEEGGVLPGVNQLAEVRELPEVGHRLVAVQDSAGIDIVYTSMSPETPRWRLAPEPTLRLGRVDGNPPYLFSRVMYAARTETGEVMVLDGGSSEIRYFDAGGRFLHAVGGAGQAPQQFSPGLLTFFIPRFAPLLGDTLFIYDDRLRRVSTAGPDGALRQESYPEMPRLTDGARKLLGRDPKGSILFLESISGSQQEMRVLGDTIRRQLHLVKHDLTSGQSDTLAVFAGPLNVVVDHYYVRDTPTRGLLNLPPAHSLLAASHGQQVIVSRTDQYELRLLDLSTNRWRFIRRTDRTPAVVDESLIARYEPPTNMGIMNTGWIIPYPDIPRHLIRGRPFLTHSEVRIAADGLIWVRDPPPPWESDLPGEFTVFDFSGRIVATAVIPADLDLFHIGADHITAKVRDEFDVEQVVVYPLIRGN